MHGNRFTFTAANNIQSGSCGSSSNIVGALALVGVSGFVLPVNLVGSTVIYDEGNTSPATFDEVSAMRAGHDFTVNRRVLLRFTTACCEGFNPSTGGTWSRIGNIHRYDATLSIRFTRRG
jgi:hypothetical protein